MLKIISKMEHDLAVPLPMAPGQRRPRTLLIKGATPVVHATKTEPGTPSKLGVTYVDSIDAVTLARLTYHYSSRTDGNGGVINIGLLQFKFVAAPDPEAA